MNKEKIDSLHIKNLVVECFVLIDEKGEIRGRLQTQSNRAIFRLSDGQGCSAQLDAAPDSEVGFTVLGCFNDRHPVRLGLDHTREATLDIGDQVKGGEASLQLRINDEYTAPSVVVGDTNGLTSVTHLNVHSQARLVTSETSDADIPS